MTLPASLPPSPAAPLFRSEAIDHISARRHGTIVLARPASFTFLTGFFVLVAFGVIAFLASFSTTRKAQVAGVVLPRQGVIRITSTQVGVVAESRVKEGDAVQAGDALFLLVSERASQFRGDAQRTISSLLQMRRDSLQAERAQQQQQAAQRAEAARRRIDDLGVELRRIDAQLDLQARRVQFAAEAVQRNADLQAANYISAAALQDRRAELLDQQQRLGDLGRAKSATGRELSTTQADLRDMLLQAERDQQAAQRGIAAIEQEFTENEARRELVVRAPRAGRVTAITAEPGQTVVANQPLATLLPAGTALDAELYVPSRSAGFIQPGMEVMLRYQAYAYQKFGQYHGRVRDVSNMPMRMDELPLPLANAAATAEPLYRVRVTLDEQGVKAYGTEQPLRPGMALDASVLLERRKLYEWVLEPLYSITGRN